MRSHLQTQSWGLILPVALGGSILLAPVGNFRGRLLAAAWGTPGLARRPLEAVVGRPLLLS